MKEEQQTVAGDNNINTENSNDKKSGKKSKKDITYNQLLTIGDYVRLLFQFKLWIIIPPIIAGALAAAVTLQSKYYEDENPIIAPKYTSDAKFIISINLNSREASSFNAEQEINNIVNSLGINIKGLDTMLLAEELITSKPVIDYIIEKHKLTEIYETTKHSKTREIFLDNLEFQVFQQKIYPFEKKPVITLTFSDKDPERARDILKDLMTKLNLELRAFNKKMITGNISFLEKRIKEVTNKLSMIEKEMIDIQNMMDAEMITRKFNDSRMSKYFIKNQTLKREYATLEKISENLIVQYELNKMKYTDASSIYILEEPEVPEESSNMSWKLIVVATGAGVFFMSVFMVYLIYGLFLFNKKSNE